MKEAFVGKCYQTTSTCVRIQKPIIYPLKLIYFLQNRPNIKANYLLKCNKVLRIILGVMKYNKDGGVACIVDN